MTIVHPTELSIKEKTYVENYCLTMNNKLACRMTGIQAGTGQDWLKRTKISNAIMHRQREVAQVCSVTSEECLNELYKIAFFDHKSYLKNFTFDPESGEMGMDLEAFEDMDTSALAEISMRMNAQGIPYVTFKPYNKVDALKELLNRLNGTNGDRHLHLHVKPEEMKDMTTQEVASAYQQMVQKASK